MAAVGPEGAGEGEGGHFLAALQSGYSRHAAHVIGRSMLATCTVSMLRVPEFGLAVKQMYQRKT